MSSSIPPVQRAKNNLQPSTSIGVGVDMPSSDVNAISLTGSINKKWKKHKSHLYNKNNKYAKNPKHLFIYFFNKERSRHAECTIKK